MSHVLHSLFAAASAASLSLRLATAQAPECTYDTCALRLQHKAFSRDVVRGASATRIARLGWFAPRIDPLASAADSARQHYAAFRTRYDRSAAFGLASFVLVAASTIVYVTNHRENDGVSAGLLIASLPFALASSLTRVKADDDLQQAIWFYNRALPREP